MAEHTQGLPLHVVGARIFWMMVGPLMLAVLAYSIATKGSGWLTGLDIAYLVILAAILAARGLEFRSGQGQTAEGLPLTEAGFRRYLMLAASVGFAVWIGANVVGNVWLER